MKKQCFHSLTGQALTANELDINSDDETNVNTEHYMYVEGIDEYNDISNEEKELIKLWNSHLLSFPPHGDRLMPLVFESFVKLNVNKIVEKNLRHNFLLMLIVMHDFGLINKHEIVDYMLVVDKYIIDEKVL
jgi:hypothetical protein